MKTIEQKREYARKWEQEKRKCEDPAKRAIRLQQKRLSNARRRLKLKGIVQKSRPVKVAPVIPPMATYFPDSIGLEHHNFVNVA